MLRSISLTLTADDQVVASQLHALDGCRRRGVILSYLIVLTIGFLTGTYLIHWMVGAIAVSVAAVASAAYGFAAYFLLVPALARRAYRKNKAVHHLCTYSWSEAGFTVAGASGQWCVSWSDYLKWRENSQTFMFYPSPCQYNLVPKRALTPEQIVDLRQCAGRISQ
jgi:hypothetical protein